MTRRETKAGLSFAHRMMMQEAIEAGRCRADALGLLEELLNRGIVETRELGRRRERIERQLHEGLDPASRVELDSTEDKRALDDLPDIDCLSLLPICQARCCKFQYALSRQDLREGTLSWETGSPYLLRHRADGQCVHNGEDHRCEVWEDRPASCRRYDCRSDGRIWLDFARRIPAGIPGLLGRDGGYRADHGHEP